MNRKEFEIATTEAILNLKKEIELLQNANAKQKEKFIEENNHLQKLADVRLNQEIETYQLFFEERKVRTDLKIALDKAKSIIEQLMNMKNYSADEQIEVIKKAKAFLH